MEMKGGRVLSQIDRAASESGWEGKKNDLEMFEAQSD
jgi:hypothetical protein